MKSKLTTPLFHPWKTGHQLGRSLVVVIRVRVYIYVYVGIRLNAAEQWH